jgi:hypothetical protein
VKAVNSQLHSAQVDHLLELYCVWRTECAAVRTAYDRFTTAEPSERALAFAAYEAALDREETAAQMYADQIDVVSAGLADGAHVTATTDCRPGRARASTASAWPWRW